MDAPDLVLASISLQIMCEFMGDAMLTIVAESRNIYSMSLLVDDDSCGAVHACSNLLGTYVNIGRSSCVGSMACQNLDGEITIYDMSCNNVESCRYCSGYTLIYSNSCSGNNACMQSMGHTKIHEYSCNSERSCQQVSGNTLIKSNICTG
jgi:ferredoxin